MFIPAYLNGIAPYGTWGVTNAAVRTDFYTSPFNSPPHDHDFGLLEASDQDGLRIGDIIGWLGWQTGRLSFNHFTTLGYPSNLDNGVLMQRNDAQTSGRGGFLGGILFFGDNTWSQGSSFGEGASGGPWVQDFGIQPDGAPSVPFGGNIVVGATSYGDSANTFIGASQFDAAFVSLHSFVCAHKAGNC